MTKEGILKDHKIKESVREAYSKRANLSPKTGCCGATSQNETVIQNSCSSGSCGGALEIDEEIKKDFIKRYSKKLGYTEADLESIPDGANLALGCGNPTAHASIKKGETVLDLGSGGGLDSFIAANKVGKSGRVIGIDMTPEMISKARENAIRGDYTNVEFRLGEIEHLPVADNSIDLIISNCVINLAPDKGKVFREAYRVLKPGGRLMVSDIVLLKELPEELRNDIQIYVSCIGGAIMKNEYLDAIKTAGFQDVSIIDQNDFSTLEFLENDENFKQSFEDQIENMKKLDKLEVDSTSIKVKAIKPN